MRKSQYQNQVELLQGTLDMLILQMLQWGPRHGYGIAQAIRANSGDLLRVETGSLYPALHRLEKKKWVKAEWKLAESSQRAKFYKLTAAGHKQLEAETASWNRLSAAIDLIVSEA